MRIPIVRSILQWPFPASAHPERRPLRMHHVLIAVWLLSMIALPLVLWVQGIDALRWNVKLSVGLQAVAVLATLRSTLPGRRVFLIAALILPASWLIEWVGSTIGWPFGVYHYTDRLTPQLGHVPLIIPPAWPMMPIPLHRWPKR